MGRGHTYGHRDSMIESAQWADSMKITCSTHTAFFSWICSSSPLHLLNHNSPNLAHQVSIIEQLLIPLEHLLTLLDIRLTRP